MTETVRPAHAGGADVRTRFERALPWIVGIVGTVLFVRPLFAAPGSSILDRVFWYDGYVNIGDFQALHRSLSEGPQGRGFLDWIYAGPFFAPQPRPLATSELMPLAGLLTWPLGSRAVLSNNVAIFVACVLNVVGGASFARSLGARTGASVVAGVAFAFSAYTNFQSGRVQLLYLFPLAFALGATWRWVREGRSRDAAIAAAWVVCEALLCLYYTVFLGLSLPLVALVGRLALARPGAWRDLAKFAGILVVFLLPIVPLLWPYAELKSHLGLTRPLEELQWQSGDVVMFLWADASTLPGRVLHDVYRWDTAYFPGFVIAVGALIGLFSWVKRDRRPRLRLVLLVVVPALLAPLVTVSVLHVALIVATVLLVRLARQGRMSPLAPALFVLAAVGLFLFGGTTPAAFGHTLGPSAYTWMFQHVPLIDGLRMIRRAGLLVNLTLIGVAALTLDRLQDRPKGRLALAGLAVLAFAEAFPLELRALAVDTTCGDRAYAAAREMGLTAVADVASRGLKHDEMAMRRHEAGVCGVATTEGPAGFVPVVSELAMDAAKQLPSPAAHAWLWDAGLRGVVLRGYESPKWPAERLAAMKGIAAEVRQVGPDVVVRLAPPTVETLRPVAGLPGEAVRVTDVMCSRGRQCAAVVDGDESTRWGTEKPMLEGDFVILRFAEAEVFGVEWHDFGHPLDVPRAVTIEREAPDGTWVPWASFPSISPVGLGREAVHVSYGLPLPPARAKGMKIVSHGGSGKFWLSATEIVVR